MKHQHSPRRASTRIIMAITGFDERRARRTAAIASLRLAEIADQTPWLEIAAVTAIAANLALILNLWSN